MNTILMNNEIFNNRNLNKKDMYKTLESPGALKEFQQIQFEMARIKEKHARAVQKGYSITCFVIREVVMYLVNVVTNQKLRL